MTLRARLAVSFALVGALASALVGFFAFCATQGELGASTDQFLVERADEIARGLRRPPTQRPGRGGGGGGGAGNGDAGGAPGPVNPVVQLPFDADAIA